MFCGLFSARSCYVSKAFPADALERQIGAVGVVVAKCRAAVVAEVKFSAVALQVLRRNVMECANQSALHDGEIAFNRVRVGDAAHVLSLGVIDLIVGSKSMLALELVVARAAVRHHMGIGVNL